MWFSFETAIPAVTYINVVFEFNSAGAIKLDLPQRRSNRIVGFPFGLLGSLDDGDFVEIALVVDVQAAECFLQGEDLALVELRVFPGWAQREFVSKGDGREGKKDVSGRSWREDIILLKSEDVHGWRNVAVSRRSAGELEVARRGVDSDSSAVK